MKVGRHLGRLKALLSAAGLIEHAVYVERASLPNQRVVPLVDLDEDRAPYFSMVLVHRAGCPCPLTCCFFHRWSATAGADRVA